MPPFEPIVVTNGILRYSGFRRASGDCVWFSTGELAMRHLDDRFVQLTWRTPSSERGWRVIPLTRIEP